MSCGNLRQFRGKKLYSSARMLAIIPILFQKRINFAAINCKLFVSPNGAQGDSPATVLKK